MTYDDLDFPGDPDPDTTPATPPIRIANDVLLHVNGVVTAVEALDVEVESVADLMRCISALSCAQERLAIALSLLISRTEQVTLR